jgi:hypothetical protein
MFLGKLQKQNRTKMTPVDQEFNTFSYKLQVYCTLMLPSKLEKDPI